MMFRLPRFLSPRHSSPVAPHRRPLVVEQLESRQVLSFTFNAGVLIIRADSPASSDSVDIDAVGSARDGSTGVKVRSNLVNRNAPTNIGGPGNPVLRITLDLQNGNDRVAIESLAQTKIRVGEGNGNNDIRIGNALDIGVAAGIGRNFLDLGAGSANGAGGLVPNTGNTITPAGTVALLGWAYTIDTSTGGMFTPLSPLGNNQSRNDVKVHGRAGSKAIIDIASNGLSTVNTDDGDDVVWIQGNGNNRIQADKGNNQIQVDGNGNNNIDSKGSGSITVNGQGGNDINAGPDSRDAVFLNFLNPGGNNRVTAAAGANVQVNGVKITSSGKVPNSFTTVKFPPGKVGGKGGGSGAAQAAKIKT